MPAEAADHPSGQRVPHRVESPPRGAEDALDPFDRFLLDEIDGKRTIDQLADAVMNAPEATLRKIEKLVEVGLVRWPEAPRTSDTVPKTPPTVTVELEPERRARIDLIHAALPDLTHYDLLGVPPDADKALLKRAYFTLSKEFHPDTQYGKQLGAYKSKMEVIFRHLTEAHDVVTRAKRKAEYDEGLAKTGKKPFTVQLHAPWEAPQAGPAKAPVDAVPPSQTATTVAAPRPVAPAAVAEAAVPPAAGAPLPPTPTAARRAFRVSVPGTSDAVGVATSSGQVAAPRTPVPVTAVTPTPAGAVTAAPSTGASSSRPPTTPSASANAISERLARDLARQTGHTPAPQPRPVAAEPGAHDEKALFRAIAGASQVTGRVDRIEHYVHQALLHEAKGELTEALSCARLALGFDPTRVETKSLHDRIDRALAAQEAEVCRARAKSEEKAGRLESAATAWSRVCLGRPDDFEAHLGVARCLLEAQGDLRKARDYGQRAVEIAPHSLHGRVLLTRVFHAAGMRLNALRELEAAAKLDPGSQLVKTLQRELK